MSFNSKHLAKGSECPPLVGGKLRIYSMRFCPYAQRAMLVALAKEIPIDVVNCNLVDKPEWLFEKNPEAKVPVIELQDGKTLYESLVVADYLDEVYPNRPIASNDPYQKALDKIWIERFNTVTSLFYKVMFAIKAEEMTSLSGLMKDLQTALVPFEKELSRRGTIFFNGNDKPGMVDYMIWPWIERLPIFKPFIPEFDFDTAKRENPKLENWRNSMKDDTAVRQFLVTPQVHKEFIEKYLKGAPNYDLLA